MLASTRVHGVRWHGLQAMLAALLLTGLDALAQGTIVYRDIEDVPLFTLSGSVFHDLDLDQNGSVDLRFRATGSDFDAIPLGPNQVLAIPATPPNLGGFVYPLNSGDVIGAVTEPPLSWENPGDGRFGPIGLTFTSCMLVGDELGCLGLFTGRNAYMGAEFQIDCQPHYGWVRVDLSQPGINGGWITEYAYDTRPGMPIVAGAVPEPSTWALLIGGGVLMVWFRRRRNEGRG